MASHMDFLSFNGMFPLGVTCVSYNNSSIEATLEHQGLWNQFEKLGTEMIITKPGRRMFPTLKFKLKGLDAETDYAILLDMYPASEHRYKYQHLQWTASGKAEPSPSPRVYCHPDSPAPGSYWMEQAVDFYKLKLTNNYLDRTAGHIVLNSMHKYAPCLHILAASSSSKLKGIDQQRTWVLAATIKFTQATFMAVTAYQNEDVTRLKILYNPFAKGFREGEQMRRDNKTSRTIKRGSSTSSETDSLKPTKVLKVEENEESSADSVMVENESRPKSVDNSLEKKDTSAIPEPVAGHLGFCVCSDCVKRSSNLGVYPHPNSFFLPSFYSDIYRNFSPYGPPPPPFLYCNYPNMMPGYPSGYYPLSARYTQPPSSLYDYDARLL